MRLVLKIFFIAVVSWFIAITLGRAFTGRPPTLLSALTGAIAVAAVIVFLDSQFGW